MTRLIEIGDKIGPYEIVEDIPESFVYKAVHQDKPGFFALKFTRRGVAALENMLLNERRILEKLDHPNIVSLEDIGEDRGGLYNVYQFINAIPTRYLVSGDERILDIRTIIDIALGVANACAYLHSQQVIHQDIKPDNILVNKYTFDTKLTDFGLAIYAHNFQLDGFARGTPHYLSPEQALGKQVDPKTDVYSLGVSLYQILTGEKPIKEDDNIIEVLFYTATKGALHYMEPFEKIRPDSPPELEQAVKSMVAQESKDRPDMEEVVLWLNTIKHELK